MIHITRVIE